MVLARKLRPLLWATIILCGLAIIVASISLSASNWYEQSVVHGAVPNNSIVIEYGLFSGVKSRRFDGGRQDKDIFVVCEGVLCMLSCGVNGEARQADILNLLKTQTDNDDTYCESYPARGSPNRSRNEARADDFESRFFHFGYWLATIMVLASGVIFSVIGGALALYNTFESPTQPIFGIFGLYIWNGCAAASSLLAMIVWGACFDQGLKENGAVSETISIVDEYSGTGSLGYAYWIMLLPVLFNLSNIGILYFHSWKLAQSERQISQVIDEKLRNGDILLF